MEQQTELRENEPTEHCIQETDKALMASARLIAELKDLTEKAKELLKH